MVDVDLGVFDFFLDFNFVTWGVLVVVLLGSEILAVGECC